MQNQDQNADMQEPNSESPPAPSEEGYMIRIEVTNQGYEVHGPEPLPAEPQEQDEDQESQPLPDLTTAIKHVLAIVKENPISQDEQEGFKNATKDIGQE